MRRLIALMILVSCSLFVRSQETLPAVSYVRSIPLIDPSPETGDVCIFLLMPYAGSNVLEIHGDTALLTSVAKAQIEVVCTDFPHQASLIALNSRRLAEAYKQFPVLKNIPTDVTVLRQSLGSARSTAQVMFHGVIIRFRRPQGPETIRHDLKHLNALLEGKTLRVDDDGSEREDTSHRLHFSFSMSSQGGIASLRDSFQTVFKRKLTEAGIDESSITMESSGETDTSITRSFYIPLPPAVADSTVWKALERNHFREMAVTADVTGSMYPYTAQLLMWLKLQSLEKFTDRYTFFNDGDMKADPDKVIGSTGGIYSKRCPDYDAVKALMLEAMNAGGGGDAPENDIEAMILAEKRYPEIKYHVLIADNWAPIKENKLIPLLKKPVRVVLCGAVNGWLNTDYLDLARVTGGSVHLIEEDINNLVSLHEGEKIKVMGQAYIIRNGKFVNENQRFSMN